MKKSLLVLAVAALFSACNCSVTSKSCPGGMAADPCSKYLDNTTCNCKHQGCKCDAMKRAQAEGCCNGQGGCNPWKNVPCKAAPAPVPAPVVAAPVVAPVVVAAPAPAPAKITSDELGTTATVRTTAIGQQITFNTPILFKTNSDKLENVSYAPLQTVANVLKAHPNAKTTVEGYTDSLGDPAYNVNLSQRRANTVMNQLIADGVAPASLSAKGYGAANPVATNKTAAGRAENRRVELNIVD